MDLTAIVKRALDRTEGVPNPDRAAKIVEYIEIAQDLTSDIGHAPAPQYQQVVDTSPSQTLPPPAFTRPPIGSSTLIVTPDQVDEPLPRLMDALRISNLPLAHKAGEQVQTVQQIEEYLKRAAPTTIDVEIESGKPPVRLARKIHVQSDGMGKEGDGTVTLSYPEKGDPDCPGVIFSSADAKIDLVNALEQIAQVARSRYSYNTEPRKVTARPAIPWKGDHEGSKGGDAEEADGAQAWAERVGKLTFK